MTKKYRIPKTDVYVVLQQSRDGEVDAAGLMVKGSDEVRLYLWPDEHAEFIKSLGFPPDQSPIDGGELEVVE